jgi:hypothetical protein
MLLRTTPRRGMANVDLAICAGGAIPVALAMFYMARYAIEMTCFLVGNSVGSPF